MKKKKDEQENQLLGDFCNEIFEFLTDKKSRRLMMTEQAIEKRWEKYERLFN